MASNICAQLQSAYTVSWLSLTGGAGFTGSMASMGYQPTTVTAPNGSVQVSEYWPTRSRLAPGCTLGCGHCAITGATVQLFYWPVTETALLNRSSVHAKREYEPLTISTFGTSLIAISPTAYVFFSNIYASDSCGPVGQTHRSSIISVNTQELSSIAAYVNVSQLTAELAEPWECITSYTAFFNFTDLNAPVPASIFDRQPWCAGWSLNSMGYTPDNGIPLTEYAAINATCPQTRSYDPVLVVPLRSIQALDPSWSNCNFDFEGAFDPPYALHGVAGPAMPTPSDIMPTQSATPASAPRTDQPAKTSTSDPRPPLPSSLPDPIPSLSGDPSDPSEPSDPKDPKSTTASPPDQSNEASMDDLRPPVSISLPNPVPWLSANPDDPKPAPVSSENSIGDSRNPQPVDPAQSTTDPMIETFESDLGGIKSLQRSSPSTSDLNNAPLESHEHATSRVSGDPLTWIVPYVFASSTDSLDISAASLGSQSTAASKGASNSPDPDPSGQAAGVIGSIFANGNPSSRPKAGREGLPSPESVANGAVASVPTTKDPENGLSSDPTSSEAGQAIDLAPLETGADGSEPLPLIEEGQASAEKGTPQSRSSSDIAMQGHSNLDGVNTIMFSRQKEPAYSAMISPSTVLSGAVFTVSDSIYTALKVDGSGGSEAVIVPSGSTFVSLPISGSATTFGAQVISADSAGVVENGNTHGFSPIVTKASASALAEPDDPQVEFTLSGTPHTAFQVNDPGYSGGVVISISSSSVLLSPGGHPATIDGQVISAASNGLVIESNTDAYTASGAGAKALFTISGKAYSAYETTDSGGSQEVVIQSGSKLLTLVEGGAPTTIGKETVSAISDGLLIGSSTERLSAHSMETITLFTISGHSFTAFEIVNPGHHSEFIIAASSHYETLVEGGLPGFIGGETVSVASGGLIVGGSTEVLVTTTGAQLPWVVSTRSSSTSTTDLISTGSTSSTGPHVVTSAADQVNMATLMIHVFLFSVIGVMASL
ncbi:MAG: hypothetical protein Q9165_003686 [Trypethelium subeluteriae]